MIEVLITVECSGIHAASHGTGPNVPPPLAAAAAANCLLLPRCAPAAGGAPVDVAPQQQAMRVDAAVEAALNLLPSNTDSATSFSLFGLLNKAQSPMGKALLKVGAAWVLWVGC